MIILSDTFDDELFGGNATVHPKTSILEIRRFYTER